MRIALFSDVHGNLTALEAILAQLDRLGSFDLAVCAGDLVFLGPSPGEVVERLRGSDIVCLRGNCEGIVTGQIPQELPPNPAARQSLTAHKEWTKARLTSQQLQWLAELPVHHRISPPSVDATGAHDLLVTHATLRSFHDDVSLCAPNLPADEARRVFGSAGARAVAFGHRHGHFISSYSDLTLVNVSSASITPNGSPTAAYTIATWHDDHWTFEQHIVPYDAKPEIQRARSRSLPSHPWWQRLGYDE